ncbi:gamma-glutamylcyclotransferase [Francisella sp. 19X1-34]|uniref:gamma-glutamylcyclotransferase n=1 Tax=Francisella sp. 19X1-34 TaxID=3087177 RepID=UPI002E357474|nr:gamma-glutamylcyclotransferase [Francisella sp. 19X1-34]MED7787934.1 gamma-glutamylcyclotransferase [Francisella sp. 19X1-34]
MTNDFKKLITTKIQEISKLGIKTRTYEQIEEYYNQVLSKIYNKEDLYLFAYGSLIWKCDIKVKSSTLSKINGFRRSFCIDLKSGRASKEHPGLMLALEEENLNTECYGKVYRIANIDIEDQLPTIWAREMVVKGYNAQWVDTIYQGQKIKALAFVMDNESPFYINLPLVQKAKRIAFAEGSRGTNREYLYKTLEYLDKNNVYDEELELLYKEVIKIRNEINTTA